MIGRQSRLEAGMAERTKRRIWAGRLTGLAALLCFGSVLTALVLAVGAGQGLWHFRIGLIPLRYLYWAAVGGGVIALVALVLGRNVGKLLIANLAALIVAIGFVLYISGLARTAGEVPPIHDVSTNLADMPQFSRLTVREDNLDGLEKIERNDLRGLSNEERWRRLHMQAYGDIRTLRVPWSPAETVQRAERLARDRGWEIARADPSAGALEATATSLFFRFKDDVVLRARPASDGGTEVDMRSISRVGRSDVGMNAKRIREFLADLQRS
jgi:uncharacterized membrane protein